MIRNRSYIVAVAKRNGLLDNDPREHDFKMIPNGKNYWIADPFPIEVKGELFIFGEIYEFSKLKGSIAYTKMTEAGFTPWKKVIEESYHLSFPNVFTIGEDIYMCPESHANRSLQIYKCVSFPEKWVLFKIIMRDEDCVDTVFIEHEKEIIGLTCEWHDLKNHFFKMFKVDRNTGEYIFSNGKHDLMESYMSRPAGKVIEDGERLIMVSQICKPLYGSGIVFKEIVVDFPNYSETELFRVYPNQIKCDVGKTLDGIHTLNLTDNYIVVDLIWSRFNFIEKGFRLLRKIENIIKAIRI